MEMQKICYNMLTMTRELLSLDFYGEGVTAALATLDEQTGTLRIRHLLRQASSSLNGAVVRNLSGAQETLGRVFTEMAQYTQGTPTVIVGVRSSFLSFRHSTGTAYTEARSQLIRESDIRNALENSIPPHLSDMLEVVDILPLSYSIDDQHGMPNPQGMHGYSLEAETFISLAVRTHLTNLNQALTASGCEEYQLLPSSVALGDAVLLPAEKSGRTLLIDLGESGISAVLYHKNSIWEGWEMPFGLEMAAEQMADLLQNDLPTVRKLVYQYEPDPIMDEVLEDSARPLIEAIHKELVQTQSLAYIHHPPTQLVLCGLGANPVLLKSLQHTLGLRKARLGTFEHVIADCETNLPQYDGVLSLLEHTLMREEHQFGTAPVQETGFFGNLLAKFGLNSLF